jgi:hypothetical protein
MQPIKKSATPQGWRNNLSVEVSLPYFHFSNLKSLLISNSRIAALSALQVSSASSKESAHGARLP